MDLIRKHDILRLYHSRSWPTLGDLANEEVMWKVAVWYERLRISSMYRSIKDEIVPANLL